MKIFLFILFFGLSAFTKSPSEALFEVGSSYKDEATQKKVEIVGAASLVEFDGHLALLTASHVAQGALDLKINGKSVSQSRLRLTDVLFDIELIEVTPEEVGFRPALTFYDESAERICAIQKNLEPWIGKDPVNARGANLLFLNDKNFEDFVLISPSALQKNKIFLQNVGPSIDYVGRKDYDGFLFSDGQLAEGNFIRAAIWTSPGMSGSPLFGWPALSEGRLDRCTTQILKGISTQHSNYFTRSFFAGTKAVEKLAARFSQEIKKPADQRNAVLTRPGVRLGWGMYAGETYRWAQISDQTFSELNNQISDNLKPSRCSKSSESRSECVHSRSEGVGSRSENGGSRSDGGGESSGGDGGSRSDGGGSRSDGGDHKETTTNFSNAFIFTLNGKPVLGFGFHFSSQYQEVPFFANWYSFAYIWGGEVYDWLPSRAQQLVATYTEGYPLSEILLKRDFRFQAGEALSSYLTATPAARSVVLLNSDQSFHFSLVGEKCDILDFSLNQKGQTKDSFQEVLTVSDLNSKSKYKVDLSSFFFIDLSQLQSQTSLTQEREKFEETLSRALISPQILLRKEGSDKDYLLEFFQSPGHYRQFDIQSQGRCFRK